MPAFNPTQPEKENLQKFYVSMRSLLNSELLPAWGVQRSFEEMMNGYMGEYMWHPSHISKVALEAVANGEKKVLQRAHGVIEGKLDRYTRTTKMLRDDLTFEEWFNFYVEHDASVILTRTEHNSNKKFAVEELISLPARPHNMFLMRGFTFSLRKNVEVVWAKQKLEEITYGNIE